MSLEKTSNIKVLAFDVFGTVVDWHGSIAREVDRLNLGISGNEFALAWRMVYEPAMRKVMTGELDWTILDDLLRLILDEILVKFKMTNLTEQDCILSAEVFKKYKPDPATYLGAAKVFDASPDEVMLVAAHNDDLAAARTCGLRTAYIERPMEYGPTQAKDVSPNPENTMHAESIVHLATLLEC